MLRQTLSVVAPALVLALTLTGCSRDSTPSAALVTGQPSQSAPSVEPAPAPEVIARINGQPLEARHFAAYLEHKRIDPADARQVELALERYLERAALAEVIADQGVLDPQAIAVEVEEFRRQMLIARYFEQYLQRQVDDQAVRNFYAAHPQRFQSRKVQVAHILIRTNPAMSQAERDALLTRAQEVHSRASAQEDFAELAREYSEDLRSAKQGGDLGWLAEGAIDGAFSAAVFQAAAGDLLGPIVTPFGFHVVKVLEGPQVITRPLEQVEGDIRYELRQQAREAEERRLLDAIEIDRLESSHEAG